MLAKNKQTSYEKPFPSLQCSEILTIEQYRMIPEPKYLCKEMNIFKKSWICSVFETMMRAWEGLKYLSVWLCLRELSLATIVDFLRRNKDA